MGNQDIRWSEEHVAAGQKFCNKIWNASRFVLMNKPVQINVDLSGLMRMKDLTIADKRILNQLKKTKRIIEKDLGNFHFGQALHELYDFFWHDFCDKYIEAAKPQLKTQSLKFKTQRVLLYVLFESLKILHPFMPFITEEIWQNLPIKNKKLLIIEKW